MSITNKQEADFREKLEHEVKLGCDDKLAEAISYACFMIVKQGYWDEVFNPLFEVAKDVGIDVPDLTENT